MQEAEYKSRKMSVRIQKDYVWVIDDGKGLAGAVGG